jgi:hypothetical protein
MRPKKHPRHSESAKTRNSAQHSGRAMGLDLLGESLAGCVLRLLNVVVGL